VQEQLAERLAAKIRIGLQGADQKSLRGTICQVVLVALRRVPRTVLAHEDDAVASFEEHLRGARGDSAF
jgi:hypothetical protein